MVYLVNWTMRGADWPPDTNPECRSGRALVPAWSPKTRPRCKGPRIALIGAAQIVDAETLDADLLGRSLDPSTWPPFLEDGYIVTDDGGEISTDQNDQSVRVSPLTLPL
jgi:hypothetical protein